MSARAFGVWVGIWFLSLCVVLPTAVAAPAKAERAPDLSSFPGLKGKVTQVLGQLGSFVPPRAGEPFQVELRKVTKLTSLTFDADRRSNIPLPGPVVVKSMRYYSNGAFDNLRLVAKKAGKSVTIDIVPKPGLGPKRVLVWVTVQSDVVEGVALIDCEADGAFPPRRGAAKQAKNHP
jgi:hypothetical protein